MNHFKSIHLKNFGPWEDQKFDLHPGVNVFIGASGAGKSKVLGGFDFVINNKTPKSAGGSFGFITRPEERGKIAEVELEVYSDNNLDKISRRKGKSTNEYQLNDDTPQKAMGVNVPDHIADIFNMKSVNYHKQKHLPFLLDEKPGQVAKQLTGIINLEEIDESVSLAGSCVRENKKILKKCREDNQGLLDQIEELKYVQEFKAEIDLCIEMEDQYTKDIIKFSKVDGIIFEIEALEAQKQSLEGLIGLGHDLAAIEQAQVNLINDETKFDDIVNVLNQIEILKPKEKRCEMLICLQKQIDQVENDLTKQQTEKDRARQVRSIADRISSLKKETNKISEIAKLSSKIELVEQLKDDFDKNHYKFDVVSRIINRIESLNVNSGLLSKQITQHKLKLSTMACPLCGRKN